MKQLRELCIGDIALFVISEVYQDEVTIEVKRDMFMKRRLTDHLLKLIWKKIQPTA